MSSVSSISAGALQSANHLYETYYQQKQSNNNAAASTFTGSSGNTDNAPASKGSGKAETDQLEPNQLRVDAQQLGLPAQPPPTTPSYGPLNGSSLSALSSAASISLPVIASGNQKSRDDTKDDADRGRNDGGALTSGSKQAQLSSSLINRYNSSNPAQSDSSSLYSLSA